MRPGEAENEKVMKAIVCRDYRPPELLRLEQVAEPVPAEDQVLIRVRAASVNPMDVHLMRGSPAVVRLFMGLRRPRIDRPGVDVAGEVAAVGAKVTGFRPGDAVFGACRGAFADLACAAESRLVAKPPALSFEEAAALPVAGLTALQGLRKGGCRAGHKVLVIGAGGGIGSFAMLIAQASGASVDAVCSARHIAFVRALGAERVIDYREEDYARGGGRYDLIFDLAGTRSFAAQRRVLAPDGVVILGGIAGGRTTLGWMLRWAARCLVSLLIARFSTQRLAFVSAKLHKDDLAELARLAATGQAKPSITARYALADAGLALAYVAEGHAQGKVVIVP
jgi:NADPH:quinone reductase-like Zn-dependent oxidoreductase